MTTTVSAAPPAWLQPALDGSALPMDWDVDTGMGVALVQKDGECIYPPEGSETFEVKSVLHFEAMADLDPDHDWRISYLEPTGEMYFQRHGPSRWMLIEENDGSHSYAHQYITAKAA